MPERILVRYETKGEMPDRVLGYEPVEAHAMLILGNAYLTPFPLDILVRDPAVIYRFGFRRCGIIRHSVLHSNCISRRPCSA
jgi:hypothetical protein